MIENRLVSDNDCNIPIMPNFVFFNKEWQIILGLHLVLVTLHMRFTISIEQDK